MTHEDLMGLIDGVLKHNGRDISIDVYLHPVDFQSVVEPIAKYLCCPFTFGPFYIAIPHECHVYPSNDCFIGAPIIVPRCVKLTLE